MNKAGQELGKKSWESRSRGKTVEQISKMMSKIRKMKKYKEIAPGEFKAE